MAFINRNLGFVYGAFGFFNLAPRTAASENGDVEDGLDPVGIYVVNRRAAALTVIEPRFEAWESCRSDRLQFQLGRPEVSFGCTIIGTGSNGRLDSRVTIRRCSL